VDAPVVISMKILLKQLSYTEVLLHRDDLLEQVPAIFTGPIVETTREGNIVSSVFSFKLVFYKG
jgi:hypothetical protein